MVSSRAWRSTTLAGGGGGNSARGDDAVASSRARFFSAMNRAMDVRFLGDAFGIGMTNFLGATRAKVGRFRFLRFIVERVFASSCEESYGSIAGGVGWVGGERERERGCE